ncbi:MAG TPA: VWA domain-containing protein [Candidatus Acidoferrales bacterium]|nr:VWA domain-containing protein [Candidatus Acidoferrales bacterium]
MRGGTLIAGFLLACVGVSAPIHAQEDSTPPAHVVHRPPRPGDPQQSSQSQQNQSSPSSNNEPVATFRSEVRLVNVFATVTDQRGAPVGGLTKDDFKVFEDGKEQKIAVFDRESAIPLSIVMAIDTSLSTRKDLPLELESARKFAHAILRPQDGMALYQFSEIVQEVLPFTSDLHAVDRAISRVHAGAATALYDALYLGSDALSHRKGRKVIVVITDGGDTASKIGYQEALRATQIAEAILYPIIMVPIEASAGRDTGGEHALIQLAMDTGGKYYYATSLPELEKAFHQISDELRTQYLVGYYPSNRVSDDFRQIKLTVDARPDGNQLIVRHRAGYYTSKLH